MPDFKKAREKQQQQYKTQQAIETVDVFHQEDAQASERSDVQTSRRQDHQASSSSDVQQKSNRNRQTVYLEQDVDDWIRGYIIGERKRLGHRVEISDVVNEAVRLFMESKSPSS